MHIAIVGGGPAGLRAAEVAATGGARVTLFDAKASVGRKFLVAGKGGLNLTKIEARAEFVSRYSQPAEMWPELIAEFDPEALRAWAAGLGVETFAASTGRVYPRALKAAPLLRAWVSPLEKLGVSVAPLAPANGGWEYPWPAAVLAAAEGQPLKSIAIRAGAMEVKGELLITRYGLEGGAIYQLGPALRAMASPTIEIDFKPAFTAAQLVAKMGPIRRNFLLEAQQRWKLGDAAAAILAQGDFDSVESLAQLAKAFPLRLTGPRPLAEAISSAGGVRWSELDAALMLRRVPGVFVAGEMIDWEAPTGGYLLHGCLATGTRAAQGAIGYFS